MVASATQQTVHFIGQPEGDLALANLVVYLAQAPKSNAVYTAYAKALSDVEQTRNDPVPLHLRNAPTSLMKGLGYGRGYQYAHDHPDAQIDQVHFPENLRGRRYYHPSDRGYEVKVTERLAWRESLLSVQPAPEEEPRVATPVVGAPAIPLDPQALAGEESQIAEPEVVPPARAGRSKRR